MAAHAPLSPSSAERWSRCPGSIAAIAQAPPEVESVYASEGTVAHAVAAYALGEDIDPRELIGWQAYRGKGGEMRVEPGLPVAPVWTVDRAMCEAVDEYCSWVRELLQAQGPEAEATTCVEARLPNCATLGPEVWGTADFLCVVGETLHVVDYKHGRGVAVAAKGNAQLLCYGTLALAAQPAEVRRAVRRVTMTIVQPRAHHPDGPVRQWTLGPAELVPLARELGAAALAALRDDAPRAAGDHCRWCRAAPTCPALRAQVEQDVGADFASLAIPETIAEPVPEQLSSEQLSEVLRAEARVKAFLAACVAEGTRRLQAGDSVPGFKLVAGRTQRKVVDEEKAIRSLARPLGGVKAVTVRKLAGIGHLERVVKSLEPGPRKAAAKLIAKHFTRPQGEPTIAPAEDPREAISAGAEFAHLEQRLLLEE